MPALLLRRFRLLAAALACSAASGALAAVAPAQAQPTPPPGQPPAELSPEGALVAPAPSETGSVIVTLREGADASVGAAALEEHARAEGAPTAEVGAVAEALDMVVLDDVTPEGYAALAERADVVALEPDRTVYPALSSTRAKIGADVTHAAGLTGAGQAIAIIDTSIDASHPALSAAVTHEACFVNATNGCGPGLTQRTGAGAAAPPCTDSRNHCHHGTHVAGIAAGRPHGGQPGGVAQGASIVAVRVFDSQGEARFSDVIRAIDFVLDLSGGVSFAAVNLSLSTKDLFAGTCDIHFPTEKAAIQRLRNAGIVTVAAAGNATGGTARKVGNIGSPACLSNAVAVSASTSSDKLSSYSFLSSKTALFAPGDGVVAPGAGTGYRIMSGTSMAAPHVAAGFAILRQQGGYSINQMLAAMRTTGTPIVTDIGTTPRLHIDRARHEMFAPGKVAATHGNRRATVTWSPPAHGSTGYRITVSPGGAVRNLGSTARSTTFTGLSNGTRYTFTVQARRNPGATYSQGRKSNLVIPKPAPPHHGFPDVATGAYFDLPVRWLRAEGITGGVGNTGRYMPHTNVTRAQMAAFLWRLADSRSGYPHHGFPDVPGSSYYDRPVRWLKAEGITGGVGNTGRYVPHGNVTRAQMAAFLWRLAGEPVGYAPHGFPDVPRSSYYDKAVRWLKAEGITTGLGGTNSFAPDVAVTRAQMAAFMHRLAATPSAWKAADRIPSTVVF